MKIDDIMANGMASKARAIFDQMRSENPNATRREMITKAVVDLNMHVGSATTAWTNWSSPRPKMPEIMATGKASKARAIFDEMIGANPNVSKKDMITKAIVDLDMHPGAAQSTWVRWNQARSI